MQANDKATGAEKKRPRQVHTIDDLVRWREADGLQGPFSPNSYPLVDAMQSIRKIDTDHPLGKRDCVLVIAAVRAGTHPDRGDIPWMVQKCDGEAGDLTKLVYKAMKQHPELIAVFRDALAKIQQEGTYTFFESLAEILTKKAQEGKHAND